MTQPLAIFLIACGDHAGHPAGTAHLTQFRPMPTVCPKCEMFAATAIGCDHCGAMGVLPTRPTFVVTGASGSGKTVLAHHLHAFLPNGVVADTDNFLGVAEFGHDAYFNVLMEFAFTVIQGGRTPVLCGTLMPERVDVVRSRDLLSTIAYINLDCSDEVREERLKNRPAWRASSSAQAIAEHVAFAAHLREREDMMTLDATALSPSETARAIAQLVS